MKDDKDYIDTGAVEDSPRDFDHSRWWRATELERWL